jgi:predicted GIY-YIG superfamily endonuclease
MIYFLLKDDDLIYIGKTTRLSQRLSEHKNKDFNSYAAINTDNDDIYEYSLIDRYKPALNKRTLMVNKLIRAKIIN